MISPPMGTFSPRSVSFACVNVLGLGGKARMVEEMLATEQIDIVVLSEIWMEPSKTKRYSPSAVFAFEYERGLRKRPINGMALVHNVQTTLLEEFLQVHVPVPWGQLHCRVFSPATRT